MAGLRSRAVAAVLISDSGGQGLRPLSCGVPLGAFWGAPCAWRVSSALLVSRDHFLQLQGSPPSVPAPTTFPS